MNLTQPPRPPVQPASQALPFHDPAFGWDTFEEFFCDYLNAQPTITIIENGTEISRKVLRARPFGRKGDPQHGIDLIAEMEGGECWEFQCKHYREWGPAQTRNAIAAYGRDAPRRFLLVTRELSEDCYAVVEDHPEWELWDAREIDRRFRELDPVLAAPILYTRFGPGWSEAFFGISGDFPLIGNEAKFHNFLRPDIRFHHRLPLVGRAGVLRQLDAFVAASTHRVLILNGRGGQGKSRLLFEWGKGFSQRHPAWTLLYVSDRDADFTGCLGRISGNLALVFDDAHRLEDIRNRLLPEVGRRQNIKLVIASRPGALNQIKGELLTAEFDTSDIGSPLELRDLSAEQTMEIVSSSLDPIHYALRQQLCAAARDCPVVAVLGAALINSGAITRGNLLDEDDFRHRVFDGLLADADAIRDRFGAPVTDDYLRLIALLGPLDIRGGFHEKAAKFLRCETAPLSHLREALGEAGLLLTTGAGTRVVPDLLSDHLVYTACYDREGRTRTFAENVLAHFPAYEFPRMLRNLAEAEWRATRGRSEADSVVEPLWAWFRVRFDRSCFFERGELIKQWANIAHLQPDRTFRLVELALRSRTAPDPPEAGTTFLASSGFNTFGHSIEWLPRMIANVAEVHPDRTARGLNVLWSLACGSSGGVVPDKESVMTVIKDIVSYGVRKPVAIHNEAIGWLELQFAGNGWIERAGDVLELLHVVAQEIFTTSVEDSWWTARVVRMQSHPLNLDVTSPLRDRLLALCDKVLDCGDVSMAAKVLTVAQCGCDVARVGTGSLPPGEFAERWDAERLKCLAVIERILGEFQSPPIHFRIRNSLLQHLRYNKFRGGFTDGCRRLLGELATGLDFEIARVAYGHYHDEFDGRAMEPGWQSRAKARWQALVSRTADELFRVRGAAGGWFQHLANLDSEWGSIGDRAMSPDFSSLLECVARRFPSEGQSAVEMLLEGDGHPLAVHFAPLLMASTLDDEDIRLGFLIRGMLASEPLQAASVSCCMRWRRDAAIPDAAWQALELLAPTAATMVAEKIVDFVWLNQGPVCLRDWRLVSSLGFGPDEAGLAGRIAKQAADLVICHGIRPEHEEIAAFVARFAVLKDISPAGFTRGLVRMAEAFPLEVFLMLIGRNRALLAEGAQSGSSLGDIGAIGFVGVIKNAEVRAVFDEAERRFASGEITDANEMVLLAGALHGADDAEAWLIGAVERAGSSGHLEALWTMMSGFHIRNAALAYPGFGRALLVRAAGLGAGVRDEIFRMMLHVGGGRGSVDGVPDAESAAVLESISVMVIRHASDPVLGPLFEAMARWEREWMTSLSREDFQLDDTD